MKCSACVVQLRAVALPSAGDFLRVGIPPCGTLVKVRVVRQMTADGRVVAEDLVLHARLTRANGIEEVGFVIDCVAVAPRQNEGFNLLSDLRRECLRQWMVLLPLRQILLTKF